MTSKPRPAPAVPCLALVALLAAATAAQAADPFYVDLLRDGVHAYDRGEVAQAARELRLACFGMLEEPKPLAACLARLALAQERSGDIDGFRETFRRLVEVEERFQAYSQTDLPPEVRNGLEQRLAVRIPKATLDGSPPVFRPQPARKAASAPAPAAAATAAPPQSKAPPAAPPASPPVKPGPQPTPPAAGTSAPSPAAQALPAPPGPVSADEQAKLETVRRQLAQTSKAKELNQALKLAREVADVHPESVEAQRLAGEASYRLSRWPDVVTYFKRGGGLPDTEPELLFYLAVALYESGDRQAAADTLRRSLPNLQRSAYVDAYARKILGQ